MPNSTPAAKSAMMQAIGISDIDELFEQIPADHRATEPIALDPGIRAEATVRRQVRRLLDRNDSCAENLNFLGAGCWQHHVPAVCDEIGSRSEFLTPVWGTPSSDHGRNQAWYEFASQLGELVGMDFVGLPVYSWGAAAGHAVRMAARLTGRHEVLVPDTLDPERLAVIRTYCGRTELDGAITVVLVGHDPATGRLDLADLRTKLTSATAAVYLESPNYLGLIEVDAPAVAAKAREHGAETVVGVDPISLGVLAPPSEYGADIVVGTTQPLGVHLNAGGGVGGFIATRDEERYARQYPTLQVSMADTIVPGERAFGMTLFHQSSYGSREDGNDWTGNSVYLWAVVNAVYMALMGPQGFADIGETILRNSAYAARRIAGIPGIRVRWPSGFFKEFVVDLTATGRTVAQVNAFLREAGIFGGKDLSGDFPDLGQAALYCVTEIHTEDDITALVSALTEAVSA
ncbi:MAG TPA: aminomethyl-transferring glycine dehydrogenase subunit GcvPA [Pseudonocardiaceae bacterium]|jgi:glycine dehydrogenase subunit 1|nr:aminomethyl-transferring glycine dehydrogenase subunit GcvPA [Pseudonocardiaceae bacterium]